MMTIFDEREASFEGVFAHELEALFQAKVRLYRALAEWAAMLMNKSAEDAKAYVEMAERLVVCEGSDEAVINRLRADFAAAGLPINDHQICAKMSTLLTQPMAAMTEKS